MRINMTKRVGQSLGRPMAMLFTIVVGVNLLSIQARGQAGGMKRLGDGALYAAEAANAEANRQLAIEHAQPHDLRRFVNGQWTYCSAPGWVRFSGRVIRTTPNGMYMYGTWRKGAEYTGVFYLQHCPHQMADGDAFGYSDTEAWWALPSGFVIVDGKTFHKLDYGALNAPTVILTDEQVAAAKDAVAKKKADNEAKALAYNLQAAQAGEAYGEYRMGQRYRDGDGVAKDLRQAREWFAKAAAQGDKLAKEELASLAQN